MWRHAFLCLPTQFEIIAYSKLSRCLQSNFITNTGNIYKKWKKKCAQLDGKSLIARQTPLSIMSDSTFQPCFRLPNRASFLQFKLLHFKFFRSVTVYFLNISVSVCQNYDTSKQKSFHSPGAGTCLRDFRLVYEYSGVRFDLLVGNTITHSM